MKLEKFKEEQENLNALENGLVKMISKTNNTELMDKFLDWQNQRNTCNTLFLEFIDKNFKD